MSEENDVLKFYGVYQNPEHDLRDLRNEVAHMIEEEADEDDFPRRGPFDMAASNLLQNTVLAFAALAAGALEYYSAMLISYEVVAEDKLNQDVAEWMQNSRKINQHRRVELLYITDVIDGNLKNRMSRVSGARNNLVHDIYGRFSEFDDRCEIIDYMEETIGTVEAVGELARGSVRD